MITVPSLDPCTDILDTDVIMITHQNGSTDTISGALFNKRNQVIISANTTLSGTPLKPGNVVRVLFTADQSANNGSTAMVINYNSENKTVKVCKNGALTDYYAFNVSTNVYKYCQAYTVLELLYNDTNFVIMGNPVVLSGTDYTIFADGTRRVDVIENNNKNMVTSNAVYNLKDVAIDTTKDDANNCLPTRGADTKVFHLAAGSSHCPVASGYQTIIETRTNGAKNRLSQFANVLGQDSNGTCDCYKRAGVFDGTNWIFGPWVKLATAPEITGINSALSYKLDIKPTNATSGLTDCNTADAGFLCGSNVSNAPQSSTGFIYLLTLKYNNNINYKTQLCFLISQNEMYIRSCTNGTWLSWKNVS